MNLERNKFIISVIVPVSFILILWIIKLAEVITGISLANFGLYPHKISGLVGIIAAPLLHASFSHLISNSIPVLLLSGGIIYFYPQSAFKVFALNYLVPGIFVWFFGRPAYHIGASGLIYGFVSFLFFSGIIRRDNRSIALALIVTFLYGGIIWGVLPIDAEISWEYHLFGALTGIYCAILFRKLDPAKKYDWEDEDEQSLSEDNLDEDRYPYN
ncbi:MAG: rhomboid family intramembrane serine protease [Ignavibacteriaceae bacterium]|jgi:membrane associated rhomboid family serine protease